MPPTAACRSRAALESAIGYARDGFPVTARLAALVADGAPDLEKSPEAAAIFLQARPHRCEEPRPRPHAARRSRATAGPASTTGDVGEELVRCSQDNDGFFGRADLEAQTARWGEPIEGTYRDVTIYETPPPTQGFAVLEMLNLLEPFELHAKHFLGPDHVHLMVQAKQIAYHDRDQFVADPRFADVPTERLISKALRRRASRADRSVARCHGTSAVVRQPGRRHGLRRRGRREGNAASLIQSLYGASARRWSRATPAWCCRTAALFLARSESQSPRAG